VTWGCPLPLTTHRRPFCFNEFPARSPLSYFRIGAKYNVLPNLQLLTDSENLSKNATPFDEWIRTRDAAFRKRHVIPDLPIYGFDSFDEFFKARTGLIVAAVKAL
jgi:hypothetical protein